MKATVILGLAAFPLATVHAADWPQFQGPDRTGVSQETGLIRSFGKEGELKANTPPSGGGVSS